MLQERIDQVVKGYELREPIGEGGYGVVYRAYQPLIGRDVAVKIILPQYANHPDLQQLLGKAVDRVNAELSVVEKVRRFILADESFTVENEQLTPSMKIRRHVIKAAYGDRLDALYKK